MKILVLGGTGFLGPHEVDRAAERGWEITIFNRGRTPVRMFEEDFAAVVRLQGDRDPAKDGGLGSIAEAIAQGARWDAVIDNSGYVPRHAKASAELLRDACRQYVFVSTLSVYADDSMVGADESAATGALADPTVEEVNGITFGPLKAACEREVRAAFGERATIVRPGLIVGPGDPTDRFTYWTVRCHRGGRVLIPAASPRTQFIDVRDLAEFILGCVAQGHGGTYNAVGPRGPLFFREMLDGCKAVVSSPVEFAPAPDAFLLEHGVRPWMGEGSMSMWIPESPEMAGFGTRSSEAAIAHGLAFRPLADTAKATLDWFLASPRAEEPLGRLAGLGPEREAELLARL